MGNTSVFGLHAKTGNLFNMWSASGTRTMGCWQTQADDSLRMAPFQVGPEDELERGGQGISYQLAPCISISGNGGELGASSS